jgi:hypothetical protein
VQCNKFFVEQNFSIKFTIFSLLWGFLMLLRLAQSNSPVYITVRKEDTEKKEPKTSTDQTTLYFTVVRGILHSPQAGMQSAPEATGEELLWDRQPGSNKGKCPCDFRQRHLASNQEVSLWSQAAAPFIMSEVT